MKVLILDDDRDIVPEEVCGAFAKKKMDAVVCKSTNEFLTALNNPKFDVAYINAGTWLKGRAVYDYFDAGSKLASALVYYNVSEAAVPIKNRTPNDKDVVHRELLDLKAVIETL